MRVARHDCGWATIRGKPIRGSGRKTLFWPNSESR